MSEKKGTTWIQELRKEQVIRELQERGIETEEAGMLEKLRHILRGVVKKEQAEKSEREGNNPETKNSQGNRSRKMEYAANLDFKIGQDDWEEFVERMELFFKANDIEDENKRKAILLTKIDAETYKIVRKVCAPQKPKDTPWKEIIEKLENFVKPKVNQTVLRHNFRQRTQKEGESITQYVATLRRLADKFQFANEEEALRDQLTSGVRHKKIQIALFKIENLTLNEAIKTATAIEGANVAADKLRPRAADTQ
ncbi:unnamed protein product [Lasius platythorax]|uniref:Paraneoplastic antigen Ma-like C-terminal domain-containing protein n=1 Tax=Lasius platythorax TaxID=488582 RepID=A0AAV2NLI6_9HYME